MSFITRHYIIALVIAPFLAVLAWYFVGQLTTETPLPAQAGQTYPLLEKSNCRYASGRCDLENVDFVASMTYHNGVDGGYLQLDASHRLSAALVSVALPGAAAVPLNMTSGDNSAQRWTLALPNRPEPAARIRLVLSAAGSAYFVDASTAFLQSP